jgi:cell division protein FtsI/penicillin-binding protein 2
MAGRRTRTLVVAGVAIMLVVGAAIPAGRYLRDRADRQHLRTAAAAFATAWRTGRLETISYEGTTGPDVAHRVAAATAGLTAAEQDRPAAVNVLDVDGPHGSRATERLHIRWDLGQHRAWEYDTSVELVRAGGRWLVSWTPAVVHPRLVAGQVLSTHRVPADRGRILGSGNQVLVSPRPVVIVGIEPGRTTNRRATATAVAAVVDVAPDALAARVDAAAPSAFVEVITLRRSDYDALRARLQPIPGTVFRETSLSLAPTASFARTVLGTVGPATAEIVKETGGRVRTEDITGLSGVQRRYDEQLAGTAGFTVTAAPPTSESAAEGDSLLSGDSPRATSGGTDAPPAVTLYSIAPVAGSDLRLSLDERTQRAAEAALASAPKPAGLVAIRPSTGEVMAVANGPASAAGYNRALLGQYPPGSTFKIVTSFALLENGLSPSSPVACPPNLNVGGRVFQNAEDEALGSVPFSTDFAQSCNTAFVGLSRRITTGQLFDAASALGYGHPNTLGVDAFTGSVPRSGDTVAHAADAIGQGTVLASPLTVATVSASVAAGRYIPPRLVLGTAKTPGSGTNVPSGTSAASPDAATPTDTANGTPTDTANGTPTDTLAGSAAGASPTPSGTQLPTATIRELQNLTGLVVTNGTGTALRNVPGQPVHGKTGTAEFGHANPPETHAWFTGYQGDLAFAIVVEGGGFGGAVAAPLAAKFLTALA